jgi:hypothetical protein
MKSKFIFSYFVKVSNILDDDDDDYYYYYIIIVVVFVDTDNVVRIIG